MKKAIYTVVMALVVLTTLAACKKNDDGGGAAATDSGTVATTPTQACNISQQMPGYSNCTPHTYQQFNSNFVPYQTEVHGGYGFCGCPAGYMPVMSFQWGLSCAPQNLFMSEYAYYSFPYSRFRRGYQNGQWTSIPQQTYRPVNPVNQLNCFRQAYFACDIQRNDSYGRNVQCQGRPCLPSAAGSYLGFCSTRATNYGYGNQGYGNQPYMGPGIQFGAHAHIGFGMGGPMMNGQNSGYYYGTGQELGGGTGQGR